MRPRIRWRRGTDDGQVGVQLIEKYRAFIDGITQVTERGAPLVTTLDDVSSGLKPETKNELMDRGCAQAKPIVLGVASCSLVRFSRRDDELEQFLL